MTWGDASAASCMASPRTFTIFRPVSKSKTPATVSATYSPKESPATAWQRSIRSGLVPRNFSMAARPPTYMAGWQNFVCSSLDSGPLMQRSSRSQPRIFSAVASISFTAGRSFTLLSIFTYCEPWPGNMRPTGSGGSAGTTGAGASSSFTSGAAVSVGASSMAFTSSTFSAFFFGGGSLIAGAAAFGALGSGASLYAILSTRSSGCI
mmetsp:Transcript_29069/g.44717  ORF Transcript_29069/g.44717 Transcript_29069/m.44717 type:complete len:207 (-) Transcript_29069:147-767(-)